MLCWLCHLRGGIQDKSSWGWSCPRTETKKQKQSERSDHWLASSAVTDHSSVIFQEQLRLFMSRSPIQRLWRVWFSTAASISASRVDSSASGSVGEAAVRHTVRSLNDVLSWFREASEEALGLCCVSGSGRISESDRMWITDTHSSREELVTFFSSSSVIISSMPLTSLYAVIITLRNLMKTAKLDAVRHCGYSLWNTVLLLFTMIQISWPTDVETVMKECTEECKPDNTSAVGDCEYEMKETLTGSQPSDLM